MRTPRTPNIPRPVAARDRRNRPMNSRNKKRVTCTPHHPSFRQDAPTWAEESLLELKTVHGLLANPEAQRIPTPFKVHIHAHLPINTEA